MPRSMKRLIASPSAALLLACSGGAKPVSNTVDSLPPRSDELRAEWLVARDGDNVTLALRIEDHRVALGTYRGRVAPAWQSFCDTKLGVTRNGLVLKQRGAIAKLTITAEVADPGDPMPTGSTTFWLRRPTPGRIDVLKQDSIVASVPVWADTRFVESIEEGDPPGFSCDTGATTP
jgi:hypothetical protein